MLVAMFSCDRTTAAEYCLIEHRPAIDNDIEARELGLQKAVGSHCMCWYRNLGTPAPSDRVPRACCWCGSTKEPGE